MNSIGKRRLALESGRLGRLRSLDLAWNHGASIVSSTPHFAHLYNGWAVCLIELLWDVTNMHRPNMCQHSPPSGLESRSISFMMSLTGMYGYRLRVTPKPLAAWNLKIPGTERSFYLIRIFRG